METLRPASHVSTRLASRGRVKRLCRVCLRTTNKNRTPRPLGLDLVASRISPHPSLFLASHRPPREANLGAENPVVHRIGNALRRSSPPTGPLVQRGVPRPLSSGVKSNSPGHGALAGRKRSRKAAGGIREIRCFSPVWEGEPNDRSCKPCNRPQNKRGRIHPYGPP